MSTLYIFDFDDTLAMTNSHVRVIRADGTIDRLDSREFAAYRPTPGDSLDFSEFTRAEGDLIQDTVGEMERAISEQGIQNVYIVTARSVGEPVAKFLESLGVSVPEVVATAGSAGKATWLTRKLEIGDYDTVFVYEDCRKNITMLKDIVEVYNEELNKNVDYRAICILPSGRSEIVEKLIRRKIMAILLREEIRRQKSAIQDKQPEPYGTGNRAVYDEDEGLELVGHT